MRHGGCPAVWSQPPLWSVRRIIKTRASVLNAASCRSI